ncbi:hypothetical protein MGL_3954 [Malassezia globosa CBS 7966]|uniref:fructose-2,6-bisphosphate 2-phosphatase n=1 Tax=Malassezia globosa (strain ATCC MYA-4612 / CBS 7966) TaxID=425265 RepID=A8QBY9_MALGO|nr:uncharacterized protein MGL_3954 [Malassezia globosa CBS 7966]EDP41746.1 hypothetical protein MGL_3954 [Malassezia globosa CBS 7966]
MKSMEKERDTNSLSCDVPRQVCTQASTGEFAVSDRDEDTTIELSRPMPAPDPVKRQQFEEKLASTPLGSTSDGLLTLLRDHPELVSNRLAQEAERILPDESVTAPRLNASSVSNYAQSVYEGGNVTSTLFPNKTAHSSPNVAPTIPMTRADSQYSLPDTARNTLNSMGDPTIHTSVLRQSSTKKRVSRSMSISRNLGEQSNKPDFSGEKIVVAMVGLPARGKSYLSNKLMRYLHWREYEVRVFNVGQLRRARAREVFGQTNSSTHTASFFDSLNVEAKKKRDVLAHECLEQLIAWLKTGGNVGIHDATNTTKARRKQIADRVAQEPGMRLFFLESTCTDPKLIEENVEVKVRGTDPDYAHLTREQAKEDFLRRIKHYEAVYEPLDADGTESHYTYCKIIDVGRSATMNLISSYLESQIAFYLLNLHIAPRNIFISRHGESQYNVEGKIGGDSDLSERGWAYARALPQLIQDHIGDEPLTVWHSSLRRTAQTAGFLKYPKLMWKSLDELDAGVCDSMTYTEIAEFYPEDYASRDDDKFNYRYRGGESYRDLVVRLEPVIMELERQNNILIIGHQAIIRALYAYFMGYDQNELPYIKVPLHTVIQLTPKAYGCDEKRYELPIEAVDTHRERPSRSLSNSISDLRLEGDEALETNAATGKSSS